MNMKISDILKGCTPGRTQTVGMMQVIPLIGDPDVFNNTIVAPDDVALVSTSGYGTLVFKNDSDKPLIVPPHAAYVTKESAQDHAMTSAGVVAAKKSKSFTNAVCIQQSQPGCIKEAKHPMVILPFQIRENAFMERKGSAFSRLWESIIKLNTKANSGFAGNLVDFLTIYKKELDNFVAEFETLPNQVGAIVLINGNVAGIEMAPNAGYWSSIWGALIRECYGSLAILEERRFRDKGEEPPYPKTRASLRKATTMADLRKALQEAVEQEFSSTEKIVSKICDIEVVLEDDKNAGIQDLVVKTVQNQQVIGQIVMSGGVKPVYASIITRETWMKNADWLNAEPFKMGGKK